MSAQHTEVARALRDGATALARTHVVAGFDGFVDEMISVVEQRRSLEDYTPIPSIGRFAELIAQAAGRSSLREIIITGTYAGGCALNLGDGLAALGVKLNYFGTLGNPRWQVFDDFAARCHSCISWGREPGRTLALEFQDGKYMLSAVSQLAEFDPDLLDRVLADGAYLDACRRAPLIALTNWTLYPHMTACWQKLRDDVYSRLSHGPMFYFDLVDPRGRDRADIAAMLETLAPFQDCGEAALGVNLNEANAVAAVLGIEQVEEDAEAVRRQAEAIRARLGIGQVVTHCLKLAAMADGDGSHTAEGPYCANPVRSTGAGDRFNAGYCAGTLLGLAPPQRLLLGKAASGYFVRQARSATPLELADFIDQWAAGTLE